jgi:ribosome-associated protein
VRDSVREAGFPKPRIEGEENGEWIIVDCGAAVAHIMQPAIRQYYHLEEIWGEKPVRVKFGAPKPAMAEVDRIAASKSPAKQSPTAAKKTAAKKTEQKATAKTGARTGAKSGGTSGARSAPGARTASGAKSAAGARSAPRKAPAKKASAKSAPARPAPAKKSGAPKRRG